MFLIIHAKKSIIEHVLNLDFKDNSLKFEFICQSMPYLQLQKTTLSAILLTLALFIIFQGTSCQRLLTFTEKEKTYIANGIGTIKDMTKEQKEGR